MQHEQDHNNAMFYTFSIHVALIQAAVHWEYENILCKHLPSSFKWQSTIYTNIKKKKKAKFGS